MEFMLEQSPPDSINQMIADPTTTNVQILKNCIHIYVIVI